MRKTDKYCPSCGAQGVVELKVRTQAGRARYRCTECRERTCFPLKYAPAPKVQFATELKPSRRYVITAAQNATAVHPFGWRALKHYCEFNDAELVVIGYRYKNPTSKWAREDRQDEWWAREVTPHLFAGRAVLNDNLLLMGDIKTQPTGATPLAGNEALSSDRSAIFGHAKVALKVVPTFSGKLPKMLWTTGAITVPSYTDTALGKKGEFHHSLAALVVEVVDDKIYHVRQLNMEANGSFMDIAGGVIRNYTRKGVKRAPRAAGLDMGDSHVDFHDEGVDAGTYGKGGIVEVARPREMVYHDLSDSYSVSHHHKKKPFTEQAKREAGRHIARAELERSCEFLVSRTPKDSRAVIVPSNHLDHLTQWIEEEDWKTQYGNEIFYLKTALYMRENARLGKNGVELPNPFTYWARQIIGKRADVLYLSRDEGHLIKGIEVGYHGDKGFNGSRGSIGQYRRLGAKTIIGHSHTPGILDGAYQVGTSSYLQLEYSSGPSSWFHTHCLIYANGKRTLINIIGGKWRLEDELSGRRSRRSIRSTSRRRERSRNGRGRKRSGATAGRRAA